MKPPRHYGYRAGPGDPPDNGQLKRGMLLVRRIAFRMARRLPSNVDVDDLIGAGMEGLLKAIEGFDPGRGLQFESYAKSRVRGAILDELRAGDALTRYGRSRMGEVTAAIARLRQRLGREPDDEEIADELQMSLPQYQRLTGDLVKAPLLSGLGGLEPDAVADAARDPAAAYDERELLVRVAAAIRALPERSQQVLALYYQEECTQAEIGAIFGVTESRVCQLLGEATARLRARLALDEESLRGPARRTARR